MTSLVSLQGQGGGRIPMGDGLSYAVSRHDLAAIMAAMPHDTCRAMHLALRQGDTATAQQLIREAAATYFASTPAAPALTMYPSSCTRRPERTNTR
jgi:hypothetical protein